jgi:hypothetical protein
MQVIAAVQRRSLAVIEPGEGDCRQTEETRRRVAVTTCRRHDEEVEARTEPGDHQCKRPPL